MKIFAYDTFTSGWLKAKNGGFNNASLILRLLSTEKLLVRIIQSDDMETTEQVGTDLVVDANTVTISTVYDITKKYFHYDIKNLSANVAEITKKDSIVSKKNFEQITVGSTVKALTSATYAGFERARITVETAQIRYRIDGNNPTTTEGHLAAIGDVITLDSFEDLVNFKAIRVSADATISITYSL